MAWTCCGGSGSSGRSGCRGIRRPGPRHVTTPAGCRPAASRRASAGPASADGRRPGECGLPFAAAPRPNRVTGKAAPGPTYAPATAAHGESVLRGVLRLARRDRDRARWSTRSRWAGTAARPGGGPPQPDGAAPQPARRAVPAQARPAAAAVHPGREVQRAVRRAGLAPGPGAGGVLGLDRRAGLGAAGGAAAGTSTPVQQLVTVIRKGTRAMQQLPASPDAFVWLRLYQAEFHGQVPAGRDDPLWWTLRRPFRQLTYHAARGDVHPRQRRCSGRTGRLHDLRHTAAYRMARDPGMPLTDVQWILGHAQLTTTQIYTSAPVEETIASILAHHARRAAGPVTASRGLRRRGTGAESLDVLFAGGSLVTGGTGLAPGCGRGLRPQRRQASRSRPDLSGLLQAVPAAGATRRRGRRPGLSGEAGAGQGARRAVHLRGRRVPGRGAAGAAAACWTGWAASRARPGSSGGSPPARSRPSRLAGAAGRPGRMGRGPEHGLPPPQATDRCSTGLTVLICADVIRPSVDWLLVTPARRRTWPPRWRAPATPRGSPRWRSMCRKLATGEASPADRAGPHRHDHGREGRAGRGHHRRGLHGDRCRLSARKPPRAASARGFRSSFFYQLVRSLGRFPDDGSADHPGVQRLRPDEHRGDDRPLRHRVQAGPGPAGGLPARVSRSASDYTTLLHPVVRAGQAVLARPGTAPPRHRLTAPACLTVAAAWKQRIWVQGRTTASRTASSPCRHAPRLDRGPRNLGNVRAFYLDIAQWAADDPARWGPWVAACPIRDGELTRPAARHAAAASHGWTSAPASGCRCCPPWSPPPRTGRAGAAQLLGRGPSRHPGQAFTAGRRGPAPGRSAKSSETAGSGPRTRPPASAMTSKGEERRRLLEPGLPSKSCA